MAIFDFILPDLAPEQYSSGEGTGYAKVMPSNAPDIFSQTQDLIDAELEAKKRDHEKDILNEKNRQAKLEEYASNIQYDPKWEHARANFDQEVNNIGDFITEWRASGKPVDDKFNLELNKRKAKLNSLKGMNDKAFEMYNKNMQTMLAGLGKDYEQADIDNYDAAISKAYEEGGVEKGFEAITTTRPLKQFDLMTYLKKNYVVPENQTGELLQTKPEELDVFAKAKWDELTTERKADVMEDLYLEGNIKEKTPQAAIKYFRDQVELWDKEQRARPRAPKQSATTKLQEKYKIKRKAFFPTSKGIDDGFTINSANTTIPLRDANNKEVIVLPTKVSLRSGDSKLPTGGYIVARRVASKGDVSYWDSEKQAKDAAKEWEKKNNATANIEEVEENGVKKYVIVSAKEEDFPVGSGNSIITQYNLGQFEGVYGTNILKEFEDMGKAHDKANGNPAGTWMKENFYGGEYDWSTAK